MSRRRSSTARDRTRAFPVPQQTLASAIANFVMLVTCLLAGVLLRRAGRVGENAHQALNAADPRDAIA